MALQQCSLSSHHKELGLSPIERSEIYAFFRLVRVLKLFFPWCLFLCYPPSIQNIWSRWLAVEDHHYSPSLDPRCLHCMPYIWFSWHSDVVLSVCNWPPLQKVVPMLLADHWRGVQYCLSHCMNNNSDEWEWSYGVSLQYSNKQFKSISNSISCQCSCLVACIGRLNCL